MTLLTSATALWALLCLAAPAMAESPFVRPAAVFPGGVYAEAPDRASPVLPGGVVRIDGEGMIPGQQVTLMRGMTVLNLGAPITVDAEGKFIFDLPIDADAQPGLHPVVVLTENPSAARIVEVRVSREMPVFGADLFSVKRAAVASGPYQAAWSRGSGAVFVTSTAGRGADSRSAIGRFDAATLAELLRVSPAEAEGTGISFAVYGVAVDDANGNLWVTTTQQDSLAVYRQSDLSLVRQFPPGQVPHARDVIVDESRGRVHVSSAGHDDIHVFDAKTLEPLAPIRIPARRFGETFTTMSLDLDPGSGTLLTVSLTTNELALVEPGKPPRVLPLPGAVDASGVAYDPRDGLVFVASQATDNLLILRAEDGAVLHDVYTGAGALSVAFDPMGRLAWVANRDAGTLTAVGTGGQIVANLRMGGFPNQVIADGQGNVWAVTKARATGDADGDQLWRITPR